MVTLCLSSCSGQKNLVSSLTSIFHLYSTSSSSQRLSPLLILASKYTYDLSFSRLLHCYQADDSRRHLFLDDDTGCVTVSLPHPFSPSESHTVSFSIWKTKCAAINKTLSYHFLCLLSMLGLVAFAIFMCCVYFPT